MKDGCVKVLALVLTRLQFDKIKGSENDEEEKDDKEEPHEPVPL